MSPPDSKRNPQSPAAGVAEAESELPLQSRVKIINNRRNTTGSIRRRDAEYFMAMGRAVRIKGSDCQIRLVESHPLNKAQESEAIRQDASMTDTFVPEVGRSGGFTVLKLRRAARRSL